MARPAETASKEARTAIARRDRAASEGGVPFLLTREKLVSFLAASEAAVDLTASELSEPPSLTRAKRSTLPLSRERGG